MPEKPSRFLTFFTTLPGVITAVATLITAVGGLLVAINEFGDDQPAAAGSPEPRPSASAPATSSAPSPLSSSPKSSPEASTALPVELEVDYDGALVRKTMTIAFGDIAYLSDGSTGSAWAKGDFKLDSADPLEYLRLYGGRPILDEFARITEGKVSKAACAAAVKHPAGEFRAKPVDEGAWVCVVRPDAYDGTYGAIHFDKVDLVDRRLTISYVIWR
ncbi:hypothetical protein AB0M47_37895 [Hamadaea sp. NPDC051192]|uniref:hypothetical protein n=1 Tax=Hamadaea sp. NPDC051192 TaxID=3154940 RepID=UPI0034346273